MIKKIVVNKKSQLKALEEDSALTWEGLNTDEENLEQVFAWIGKYTKIKNKRVYITSGSMMNLAYGLVGGNAYSEDLNIVSVKLSDIEEPMKLALPRFQVGARWFDDIVANELF